MINRCTYSKNQPGFSANHHFLPSSIVKGKIKPENVFVKPKKGKELGADFIIMCNTSGITGGETNNNMGLHLLGKDIFKDLVKSFEELNTIFGEIVSALRGEGKIPSGLIYGGEKINNNNDSQDFMVILKYLFERNGVSPTVFWGTKKADHLENVTEKSRGCYFHKSMFYSGNTDDEWSLSLSIPGIKECITTKKEVCDAFDYIRIAWGDKIKFSDTDWVSGAGGSLNKGTVGLSIEDVLKKHNVSLGFLDTLG